MIIQNILFPSRSFNPTLSAYIRVKGTTNYAVDIKELQLGLNARAEFNTFFNGFSFEKWTKYTSLQNMALHLVLSGSFTVVMYNEYRSQNKNVRKEICRREIKVESDRKTEDAEAEGTVEEPIAEELPTYEIDMPIPDEEYRGMISFVLISHSEQAKFFGGYFYTEQDESEFKDVRFAIDICTFRREKYVARNMDMLKNQVFSDPVLGGKFEVFISDNGSSLPDGIANEYVHVFPNKNAGGAGGFGRSMVEILKSPNYDKFTHIIMMDDDIVFSYETLYRTFIMAKTLKPEHESAFIGGSMLCINDPKIQSEAKNNWEVTKNAPVKYRYHIDDLGFVLKNEIEDKGNHFGWWYCVMPIGVVQANNLPLPLFIKRDDIEYGIRNGRTFINLNGLCVLHQDFGNKRQGYLEYYYWRNMCILNAIHFPSYNGETLKKQLKDLMMKYLIQYRYNDANLAFVGVEDFLRGVDWLKDTDVEDLNTYIMDYTYKAVPTNMISPPFIHGLYENALKADAGLKKRVTAKDPKHVYRTVLKSWLHKASGVRYVPMNNPPVYSFYRIKTVINYDESSDKAFVTKKSFKLLHNVWKNYKKICKLIDKKYESVKAEYRTRSKELITLDFWQSYLGLDGTVKATRNYAAESVIVNEKELETKKRKKTTEKRDRKYLRRVQIKRLLQQFARFVLPIKRNRITFYLHERIGYTCNLKYIAEALYQKYGKKADIVWVTKYPETCKDLEKKGFRVIPYNSKKHLYYQFTSKVIVVNDAFPEAAVLRLGQFTVNTWHAGMNYKKIGPATVAFRNQIAVKFFQMRNKQPKVYLSGSEYFTEDTSRSFGFDKKVFVPAGAARNDILFEDNASYAAKIKQRYYLDKDTKLLIYAPTFRKDYKDSTFEFDFDAVIAAMKERFGGTWKILYRRHYFVHSKDVKFNKDVIDVSDYSDMNELLAASDALISDYSSCLWDFSFTKRPSFVYATDLDNYHTNDRDFSYPIEKWPFDIARNNEELVQAILAFDQAQYALRVAAHHKDAGAYDDGHATERALEIITKKMKLK